MKTIYFIRHGESEANVANIHGKPSSPLTEKGKEQAQFIAQRCSKLSLETLITSTYTRTKQTAEYISAATGLALEASELFVENGYPSAFEDIPRSAPESQQMIQEILKNWGKLGYHFADEENFEEIQYRVDKALLLLTEHSQKRIGVVTHGAFLRNIVGGAILKETFTPQVSSILFQTLQVMENTALTVLNYDEKKTERPWSLQVWNDSAHLG